MNSKVLLSFLILACFFVFNINTEATVDTVPHQISYQGKLTDTQGVPVNGPVEMTFTIVDSSNSSLWDNTLQVTVTNGHFSTSLGSEVQIPATIFQNSNLRLNISINGESFMSPINLLASPYAFNAELLDGVDSDQFLRSDEDDTMTGNLSLDGNFVLTGTATVQNKLLVKVNDATKDWALSVLREDTGNVTHIKGQNNTTILKAVMEGDSVGVADDINILKVLSTSDKGQVEIGVAGNNADLRVFGITKANEFQLSDGVSITSAYQAADQAIQDDVNLNEAARINEDANIRSEFAEADDIIQADVNQNEADSDSADTTLQENIDSLDTAYKAADVALITEVETVVNTLMDEDTAIRGDFAAADAAMQADVNQNEADSDSADTTLQENIDSLDTAYKAADVALITEVETVVNTLMDEDTAIRGDFAAADTALSASLTTAYEAADTAIQADVNQNEADSDSADAAIRSELATALLGAESTFQAIIDEVQTDIDQNEADSNSADATLQENIDSLDTAYKAADTTLQANINSVATDLSDAETLVGDIVDG
ncbi:hypothetical protein CL647_05345, partial [bacterium]|nr:hypothetical protein [bacterium]